MRKLSLTEREMPNAGTDGWVQVCAGVLLKVALE